MASIRSRKISGSKNAVKKSIRPYRSDIRQSQKQSTRQRIVDTGRQIQLEWGEANVTYHAIAKRARVGLRTVFRNFPTRSELFAAMDQPVTLSITGAMHDINDLPPAMNELIRQFETFQNSPARFALSPDATKDIRQLLQRTFDPDREKIAAITELLLQPAVWKILTDQLGVSKDDLPATLLWTIQRVIARTLLILPNEVDETDEQEAFID